MPKMTFSHLEASILFALVVSIVMGVTSKETAREQLGYVIYCFGGFLLALFGLGWLMHFGHR